MDIINGDIYTIVEYTTSNTKIGFEKEYEDTFSVFDSIFDMSYRDIIRISGKYKTPRIKKMLIDIYYNHCIQQYGLSTLIGFLNKKNIYKNIKEKYII